MALPAIIIASAASTLLSQALWQSSQVPPAWGVFDSDGNAALDPDSVLEFSYHREYEISNFPVQQGAFASYNKVIKPFEVQMRFSKAGTQTDRATLLSSLESLIQSLDLYTVVTPEGTYENCNPQRYEVTRRGPQGAFFLTEIELYLIQIVQISAQYVSSANGGISQYIALPNAASASAQPVSNVGNVQPQVSTGVLANQGASALSAVQSWDF